MPWNVLGLVAVTAVFIKAKLDGAFEKIMRPKPAKSELKMDWVHIAMVAGYSVGLLWAVKKGAKLFKKVF